VSEFEEAIRAFALRCIQLYEDECFIYGADVVQAFSAYCHDQVEQALFHRQWMKCIAVAPYWINLHLWEYPTEYV